jgi:hypothetical protein
MTPNKDILIKLFKIAENQQKILKKLAQFGAGGWTRQDAETKGNNDPPNFEQKVQELQNLIYQKVREEGVNFDRSFLRPIFAMGDRDKLAWDFKGNEFKGWSIFAIKKLIWRLRNPNAKQPESVSTVMESGL